MYVGAVTVEAPTPSPPMNLKKEKLYGSIARPEPIAEKKYKTPIYISICAVDNYGYSIDRKIYVPSIELKIFNYS